jgi:hypothetical protein
MQRGYDAARNSQNSSDGKGKMSDKPNYGGWSNPWGPMSGPMEQWFTAVRAWTEMWSSFAPGGRGSAWQQPWNTGSAGYSGWAAPPLSVRIVSQRQAEVTANLTPGAEYGSLATDVPGLSGVSIFREGGKVCVSLQVETHQAAGHFSGRIKADGRDVGSLAVTIVDPSDKSV